MGLLRKLFYRKPPDGLLEIADRVFVFDRCFTNEYREDKDYKGYIGGVVTPLRDQFPEASLLVFNFGNAEADAEPHLSQAFTEHDTTLMDYPSHYVGCPLLSMELVHHFLRSSESWLALGPHNLLLLHCQPGAWLVLAFMLAVLLLYRRLYSGELRTLDMVYKQAPPHLVSLLSPLNPVPSQLRYLQYVSRRNVASQWPPLDRTLLLDCIILRLIPNFSDEGGCRPLFRLYGPDPLAAADRTPKLLFATPHNSRALRLYKQAESEFVKIDINCNIQGDVVLECTNLQSDMEHEDVMFRIMFNTAFVRSNILILTRDEIDTLWNTKDNFPKDFRAEVLFSDTDATTSAATANSLCFEEKEGLPIEAFSKVQEFFSHVNWLDSRADAALSVMQKISASYDSCKISDSNDVRDSQSSTVLHNSTPQKPKEESTPDINSNLKDQDSQRKLGSSDFGVRLDKHEPAQIIGDAHKTSSSMLSGAPATTNVLQSGSVHEDSSISAGPQATFISPSPPPPPLPPPPSSTLTVPFSSAEPKLSEDSARNLGAARSPPMTMLDTSAQSSGDKLSGFTPPPLPTPPVPPSVDSAGTSGSSAPKVHSISPSKENYRKAGSPPAPPCPLKLDSPKSSSALVPPPPPLPPPPSFGSGLSSRVIESKPQASSSVPCMPAPPPPPLPPSGSGLSSRVIESKPQSSSSIPCAPPFPANLSKAAPKTGTPIPAPAPPPGSLNVRGRNLSHSLGPKNPQNRKLKPLHWLKLTRAVQGSLWAETQKSGEATNAPEIDMSELENLFSASVPNADRRAASGKSRLPSSGPKSEKVQLIDLRRAYNCEIMLSKVKVPLQELMVQVLSLEDSALDIDQVENLIKFCPTKEEMELLKGYTGEFDKLGKCEQFFLELMPVPRAEAKLRVFSFKMQFKTQVSDLRKSLNTVNSASDQIRSSVKLKRIMQTILQLGNALNQGTARGAAVGFRLDSLLKLTETRARNNKMTLMHYLCKVIAEKLPELLDFSNDLTSVEPASKIQLKFLAEEMQAVNKGLEKVVQELSSSENDGPVSEEFHKNLKEFLCFAEAEVRSLALLYSGVGRNVDALIVYFGEDPSRCPFEQVVTTLLNFLRMFNQAHEENCKQLEVEKKKAEKELQDRKEANQKEPDRLRGKIR